MHSTLHRPKLSQSIQCRRRPTCHAPIGAERNVQCVELACAPPATESWPCLAECTCTEAIIIIQNFWPVCAASSHAAKEGAVDNSYPTNIISNIWLSKCATQGLSCHPVPEVAGDKKRGCDVMVGSDQNQAFAWRYTDQVCGNWHHIWPGLFSKTSGWAGICRNSSISQQHLYHPTRVWLEKLSMHCLTLRHTAAQQAKVASMNGRYERRLLPSLVGPFPSVLVPFSHWRFGNSRSGIDVGHRMFHLLDWRLVDEVRKRFENRDADNRSKSTTNTTSVHSGCKWRHHQSSRSSFCWIDHSCKLQGLANWLPGCLVRVRTLKRNGQWSQGAVLAGFSIIWWCYRSCLPTRTHGSGRRIRKREKNTESWGGSQTTENLDW